MNLKRLEEISNELRELVDSARGSRDEFAVHVFRSRKAYRFAVENATKSGKRVDMCVEMTYVEACKFGYTGRIHEWRQVLRPGA